MDTTHPTVLIPFFGSENWKWFVVYCDKIGKKPVDFVADIINHHAIVIKDEEEKRAKGIDGQLGTYSDMGMEGYEAPVLWPLGKSSLEDMVIIGSNDSLTIFNSDGTIASQGQLSEEALLSYCKARFFAKLDKKA